MLLPLCREMLLSAERLTPVLMIALFAVLPIGLHVWGTKDSDDELEALIDFLGEVAEARRQGF